MKFALARPCKWSITYTIDLDSDKKEYRMVFSSSRSLYSWMANNEDKTIVRMIIMYDY